MPFRTPRRAATRAGTSGGVVRTASSRNGRPSNNSSRITSEKNIQPYSTWSTAPALALPFRWPSTTMPSSPQPVGQHRGHHRHRDEGQPSPRAAVDHAGVQRPESDRGDQEPQAGTRLGDPEETLRDFDVDGGDHMRDVQDAQARIDEPGGEPLQRRHQERPERHQEHQVRERHRGRPGGARAQHRQCQDPHHGQQHELPPLHDAEPLCRQPHRGHRQRQQGRGGEGAGAYRGQVVAALPGEPSGNRSDQEAVAERTRRPPYADGGRHLGVEHREQRHHAQAQTRQGSGPGAGTSGHRGRAAAHAG